MIIFEVKLGARSYPIYIGEDILIKPELLKQHIHGDAVFIVSNDTVAPLYLDKVLSNCEEYRNYYEILPDGEKYKNLETRSRS